MKSIPVFLLAFLLISSSGYSEEQPASTNLWSETVQASDDFLDQFGQPISIKGEDIQLKFDGEFRYRFEYRDDFNFNNATFEDDGFSLFRTRLGAKLTLGPFITIYGQGQDSESFASREAHKSPAFINRLDLHQLYGEFKSPIEEIPLSVKVGRQELSYGDQRFVGAFGWSNVARVFDAVKLIFTPTDWFQIDAWFSRVVRVNKSQPDSAQHDDNFYGIYSTLKPFDDHVFETFLFIRHNTDNELIGEQKGQRGQLKEYTIGNRFKGKKWGFDYGLEWAAQFGSRAHNDIRAWAWHNELGYTFGELPWDPRLSFQYNYGSGDSDPRDGNVENFDNLFPTNHIHYGYMDFFSLKNMHNIKLGLDAKPHSDVKFIFAYHWFFLDNNGSPWFNAGQRPIRLASPGASPTVGQEMDLLIKWKVTNHLNFLMGYSHFHAGAFARDTGFQDNANFFYVQTALKI